ncbi:MAG: glycosyltransferase, partial [Planctomycetota bacterium]
MKLTSERWGDVMRRSSVSADTPPRPNEYWRWQRRTPHASEETQPMTAAPHVLFAGGGAVGHVYPGLAIAEHLVRRIPNVELTFAGSGQARERHLVRTAGYRYAAIPAHGAPQNPVQALRYVTDNVAGYCAARWMLREQKVSLVVSLGGHASATVVKAAIARGIPVVLLEQNAVPSRTTRRSSESMTTICAAFDEIRSHLHVHSTVVLTGNPSRPEFERRYHESIAASGRPGTLPIAADRSRESQVDLAARGADVPASSATSHTAVGQAKRQKRLVIIGGAGGARSLNEHMPIALKQLKDRLQSWQVVHQTGEGQLSETENRYREQGVDALVVSFIDEIASVLFASDLVVCRASGPTIAELALAGLPALLVPFPLAVDDHQTENSRVVAAAGAA